MNPTLFDRAQVTNQITLLEERNRKKAAEIPDSAVFPQGGGVFIVKGSEDYWVDLDGPTPYSTCCCMAWETSNPNRNLDEGLALRCKHILKVEMKHTARRDTRAAKAA